MFFSTPRRMPLNLTRFWLSLKFFMYYVNICKLKISDKRKTEYSIAGTFPPYIDLEELFVNQGRVITVELQ